MNTSMKHNVSFKASMQEPCRHLFVFEALNHLHPLLLKGLQSVLPQVGTGDALGFGRICVASRSGVQNRYVKVKITTVYCMPGTLDAARLDCLVCQHMPLLDLCRSACFSVKSAFR